MFIGSHFIYWSLLRRRTKLKKRYNRWKAFLPDSTVTSLVMQIRQHGAFVEHGIARATFPCRRRQDGKIVAYEGRRFDFNASLDNPVPTVLGSLNSPFIRRAARYLVLGDRQHWPGLLISAFLKPDDYYSISTRMDLDTMKAVT